MTTTITATLPWKDIVAKKRSEIVPIPREWVIEPALLAKIKSKASGSVLDGPSTANILTAEELDITGNYSAVKLVEKMAAGQLTSVQVTTAFSKRAAVAQQLINCLTETFFDRALDRAKELDEYLKKHGKPIGPLHGLPVSLKDCFNIAGIPSTIGFVSFIGRVPEKNSGLVDILLKLGAVLYVKTNLPQTIMTADTDNNIFGRTLNPHNIALTAGGSSGGEGGLVALRGSCIGIGTDIAGSVRIPALCCGVYGFRTSLDRIPYGGQMNPGRNGMAGIKGGAGPLTNYAEDIQLSMETIFNADSWSVDQSAVFAPYRKVESKQKLRLGLIMEDPDIPLQPPTLRTMKEIVKTLEAAGHEIIPITKFPSIHEATKLAFHFFSMDTAGTAFANISRSGEPRIPSIATSLLPQEEWIDPNLDNLYDLNIQRDEYKSKFRDIFMSHKLDAFIMPGNAGPAQPHDTYGLPPYTVFLNFLNWPAVVLPYGIADEALDRPYMRDVKYLPSYQPLKMNGAPCSVQLVGRPQQDEELMETAKVVAEDLQIEKNMVNGRGEFRLR